MTHPARSRDLDGQVPPDAPVYVISVAAELVGAHPQTLRAYENAGLIAPARTDGGARRYSPDDIDRLRRIQALTDEGISLAGVARILELERRLQALSTPSTALLPRRKTYRTNSIPTHRPRRSHRSATGRSSAPHLTEDHR